MAEIKYPVKYAVLGVKKPYGYGVDYDEVTIGYIVSKCYVISSTTKYYANGTSKTSNIVFFPYNDIQDFELNNPESLIPIKMNLDYYGNIYPVEQVAFLYDTYEDANEYKEVKNNDMMRNLINRVDCSPLNPDYDKEYGKLITEYEINMDLCRKYEKYITEKTCYMEVSKDEVSKRKVKNNAK